MIISASRRTDIPAYFSEWFLNRIEAQYAYVRNPMNIRQVSSISLSPELVDCIVFWSKNPRPLMDRSEQLHNYMYYFQFTLNAYGKEIEQNLPTLDERINTFQVLSEKIGRQRVIWRYDPVLLNDRYTISWHAEQFDYIARKLCGHTDKVTISFIDLYRNITGAAKKGKPPRTVFCTKRSHRRSVCCDGSCLRAENRHLRRRHRSVPLADCTCPLY